MVLRPVETAGSDYPLTQSQYPIRTEFLAVLYRCENLKTATLLALHVVYRGARR